MAKHFHRELAGIKKSVLSLGALVEERVRMVIQAVEDRDPDLARQIIKLDYEIDEREVELEEECLKALALHQPVAVDLRFLIAVIKINNELERIGDQAVNIAQRVWVLAQRKLPDLFYDYSQMSEKVMAMLKMSLDSLVGLNESLAFRVLALDDEVDHLKSVAYDQIKTEMKKYPEAIGHLINLYLISRHLERLADHATNIAEEVIYLIEGEIVRHHKYPVNIQLGKETDNRNRMTQDPESL
ncbi:MAG: phosphate signaling complex protein PhoU [Thermodesulfobacteriota bacterium]